MRRRVFLSACGVALIGSWPQSTAAAGEAGSQALLALAEVVVPDKDPAAWRSGPAAVELCSRWRGLEDSRRRGIETALKMLDSEAGSSFISLDTKQRTALVRRLIDRSADFASNFSQLRPLIVRSFYSSRTGFERTGYSRTTQFIGYPEYTQTAENLE